MYRKKGEVHNLPVGGRTGTFQDGDITRIVLLEGGRWILHRPGVAGHLRLEELKRDVSERSKEVSQKSSKGKTRNIREHKTQKMSDYTKIVAWKRLSKKAARERRS